MLFKLENMVINIYKKARNQLGNFSVIIRIRPKTTGSKHMVCTQKAIIHETNKLNEMLCKTVTAIIERDRRLCFTLSGTRHCQSGRYYRGGPCKPTRSPGAFLWNSLTDGNSNKITCGSICNTGGGRRWVNFAFFLENKYAVSLRGMDL